jgi:hypothetical protein
LKLGLRIGLGAFGGLLLALLLVELAGPPWYHFPEPAPFSGPHWYNPYDGYSGQGLRANFHAHARKWGGLTAGEGTDAQVAELYSSQGYAVAALSNYQSIAPPPPEELGLVYVPTYEHGVGAPQVHFTVVGARSVLWFDYLFWSSLRHRQHMIELLGERSELLFLNHPEKNGGFPLEDMSRLTGYTGIEIRSRHSYDTDPWDTALSAGRVVWGAASDDAHWLINKPLGSGRGWLVIAARDRSAAGVIEALREGRFYAVWDRTRAARNDLVSATLVDGVLEVTLEESTDSIRFVGQGGAQLSEVAGARSARYRLVDADRYVRVEVRTHGAEFFLNPVYRHPGDPFAQASAERRAVLTWTLRLLALALLCAVVALRVRRARRSVRASAASRRAVEVG